MRYSSTFKCSLPAQSEYSGRESASEVNIMRSEGTEYGFCRARHGKFLDREAWHGEGLDHVKDSSEVDEKGYQ
jgi:hypothetical protein